MNNEERIVKKPPFEEMVKHNNNIESALKSLLKTGSSKFNKCFDHIIAAIQEGTVTQENIFDTKLYNEYFKFIADNDLHFYDLQGSEWEFFFTCVFMSVQLELLKPTIRDSSKLYRFIHKENL